MLILKVRYCLWVIKQKMQKKKKYLVIKSIKYQDLISCSYGIKLTPVDGKYSKPCKFYFDKDFV